MEFSHKSVLLKETIELLHIRPGGVYVDGTLGGGGHAEAVLRRLDGDGRLIGIDQDAEALDAARERLAPWRDKTTFFHSNFSDITKILKECSVERADGILLDLGVSSYQLDNGQRGFTYKEDVPLDMRMDVRQTKTARDIVNTYSETALYHVLRDYGEEPFAKNIAKHIAQTRKKEPIETTGQLTAVIKAAVPMKVRARGGHPAKRTFQALRIELNHELDVLRDHLEEMVGLLSDGGRIGVITFHSLEDRIVKTVFRTCENPCICPPDFPVCTCGRVSKGKVVTRKPVIPGEEELSENSRAKSAKLRVFERIIKET